MASNYPLKQKKKGTLSKGIRPDKTNKFVSNNSEFWSIFKILCKKKKS